MPLSRLANLDAPIDDPGCKAVPAALGHHRPRRCGFVQRHDHAIRNGQRANCVCPRLGVDKAGVLEMLDHAAPMGGKVAVRVMALPRCQNENHGKDRQKHKNSGGNHAADAGVRLGGLAVGIGHLRAALALVIAATTETASS